MISRVAENCYWLNRYVERVEVLSRMLGVNLAFQLDVELEDAERWRPLVVVTGQEADFLERTKAALVDDADEVQEYLTWSEDNSTSLISSVFAARENARTIRETISLEMWETLNDLWVWLNSRESRLLYRNDRHAFYLRLRNQCLLFHGIAQGTMLHEDPFEFMRLGTSIERVGQTARILDIKHHSVGPTQSEASDESPTEIAYWLAILRFCSGVEPFLKRRTAAPSGTSVAEFLIFDPAFARSIVHNLDRTANFLNLVRPSEDSPIGKRSSQQISEIRDRLQQMTIESVLDDGLHNTLTWIVDSTALISNAVHADFFNPPPSLHAPALEPLGTQVQEQSA